MMMNVDFYSKAVIFAVIKKAIKKVSNQKEKVKHLKN